MLLIFSLFHHHHPHPPPPPTPHTPHPPPLTPRRGAGGRRSFCVRLKTAEQSMQCWFARSHNARNQSRVTPHVWTFSPSNVFHSLTLRNERPVKNSLAVKENNLHTLEYTNNLHTLEYTTRPDSFFLGGGGRVHCSALPLGELLHHFWVININPVLSVVLLLLPQKGSSCAVWPHFADPRTQKVGFVSYCHSANKDTNFAAIYFTSKFSVKMNQHVTCDSFISNLSDIRQVHSLFQNDSST
jgi:hypothetical protein